MAFKYILSASILSTVVTSAFTAAIFNTPAVWECDAPGTEGFFTSDQAVTFGQASAACASSGSVLADITNQRFLFATDAVNNCVGDNENAWIGTWDYNPTNPQNRDCLAIYVGFSGPGDGIDIECSGNRYALCMVSSKRHTNVTNVRNYGAYNTTATVTVTTTETVILPGFGSITDDASIYTLTADLVDDVATPSPYSMSFAPTDGSVTFKIGIPASATRREEAAASSLASSVASNVVGSISSVTAITSAAEKRASSVVSSVASNRTSGISDLVLPSPANSLSEPLSVEAS